jgi:hypothetical protein
MDETLEKRIADLERKLKQYERLITVTPTRAIFHQSVLITGTMNADRVYTKRDGTHVELTS